MKLWPILLFMAAYAHADIAPPFVIGSQPVDDNFREAFQQIDRLDTETTIIASTIARTSCAGCITIFSTGTIPANTSITISSNALGVSYIGSAVCGQLGTPAATTVSVGSLAGIPVSFTVFNGNAIAEASYTCITVAKP